MPRSFPRLALIVMLFAAGCVSQAEFLNNNQYNATQTAVSRAQFEMNCQQVTPVIISREVVQPALQGPWVNGIQRLNIRSVSVAVDGAPRLSSFAPSMGMAVLLPAPAASTLGNRRCLEGGAHCPALQRRAG